MKIELIIIVFLAGFALGYILCDLLTTERKVVVNVKKQKVKGENNVFDAVVDVQIDEKKERKGIVNWLKDRKLQRQDKRNKL